MSGPQDSRGVRHLAVSMPKLFTTGQAAKMLGVAPRTVSKWFDSGVLKGYRIPGSNDRRIPAKNLRAFVCAHKMEMPPELGDEVVIAFGLHSDERPEGVRVVPDSFALGLLLATEPVGAALIGDILGYETAKQAALALRKYNLTARVALLAGEDNGHRIGADEGVFDKGFQRPADWTEIVGWLTKEW